MPTVSLHNGNTAVLYYSDHMWRSTIGGVDFCSQTLDVLIRSICDLGYSVLPEAEEVPIIPEVDQLFEVLKKGKLEEKQRARQKLIVLSMSGDQTAHKYLNLLPAYKPTWEAKFYTKQMGKHDFRDVYVSELHEHVTNIVLRNKLLKELADFHKVDLC